MWVLICQMSSHKKYKYFIPEFCFYLERFRMHFLVVDVPPITLQFTIVICALLDLLFPILILYYKTCIAVNQDALVQNFALTVQVLGVSIYGHNLSNTNNPSYTCYKNTPSAIMYLFLFLKMTNV